MTIQLTPPSSTPDHASADPDRAGRVTRALSSHPKRSLRRGLPVRPRRRLLRRPGRRLARVVRRLRRRRTPTRSRPSSASRPRPARPRAPASSCWSTPRTGCRRRRPGAEVTDALAAEPDVAEVTSPTTTRGEPGAPGWSRPTAPRCSCSARSTADADDDAVAESVLDTFDGQDDVTVGGSAVVGFQLGSTDRRGPRPGRAVRVPAPARPLADLLPRPRRADAAGRRRHHRARHVPGAHRHQRSSTA